MGCAAILGLLYYRMRFCKGVNFVTGYIKKQARVMQGSLHNSVALRGSLHNFVASLLLGRPDNHMHLYSTRLLFIVYTIKV